MRLFECETCGNLLYFENVRCEQCGAGLAFDPRSLRLGVRPDGLRLCANAGHDACNWLATHPGDDFCTSCRLNRTIPDLSVPGNVVLWRRLEAAKRRAVYGILRLGLFVESKADAGDERGLAFDFLADPGPSFREVMTGHSHGVITINIAEADDVERERQRATMAEPFRTLLGHMRHEMGHFYWMRLVETDWNRLAACRALFGDDRADYARALEAHYADRAATDPSVWRDRHVSHYAATHPWEDWAETWAHYLHMVDTVETAYAFGLRSHPRRGPQGVATTADFDPYAESDFDRITSAWLPLTFAVNSLNRAMGQPDLYPFVLAPAVMEKLRFVHHIARGH